MTQPSISHSMIHQGSHRATAQSLVDAIQSAPELYLPSDGRSVAVCILGRQGHRIATIQIKSLTDTAYSVWPAVMTPDEEGKPRLSRPGTGAGARGAIMGNWVKGGWTDEAAAVKAVALVIQRAVRAMDLHLAPTH